MNHLKDSASKIILLEDIYDLRRRKEDELRYYNEQLEKLKEKMFFVNREIELTTFIIDIIENERVTDIKKLITDKRKRDE